MSEQLGALLQTKSSFDFHNNTKNLYRAESIDSSKFSSWQSNNMYKSSYGNFHSKVTFFPSRIPHN